MSFLANLRKRLLALRQTRPPSQPWYSRTPWSWTVSGAAVSPDNVLTVAAVWRCIGYISSSLAGLQWDVRRRSPDNRIEILDMHPVTRVLSRAPNPEMTPFTFREALYHSVLAWGNGYAEIERDGAGRVRNLWFLTPERVTVKRSADEYRSLYYEVGNNTTGRAHLDPQDIIHLKGLGYDGDVGFSVVAYAATSLGAGIALDEYSSSLFGNSAVPSGILTHPGKLKETGRVRVKQAWDENMRGPRKGRGTVVLEEGITWTPTTMPNDDSQFLQSREFSVLEVCRWFGVPPNKVFDWSQATYNNFEQANREVVQDTLAPWARRLEQEIDLKLLGQGYNGLHSRMDLNDLMRGDSKTRSEYYQDLFKVGALSPDDIREAEGKNPLPDGQGDEYFIAANNFQPLKRVLAPDPAELAGPAEGAAPPGAGPADPVPATPEEISTEEMTALFLEQMTEFLDHDHAEA